jgi:hypothetical protein
MATRQRRVSAPRQARRIWTVLGIVLSLAGPATRALAQDTSAAVKLDSTAARLEALERSVQLLKEQLAAQASSAASTKSRSPIEFSGRILMNAFMNQGRSNNVDVPTLAVPAAFGYQDRSAGATFRQTILSVSAQGAKLWGADASAMIETDFFGGAQTGAGGRPQFPGARLRIARAMLTWETGELMVGQDVSLLTPVIPVGLASLGESSFSNAGHLWSWLPQVRVTKSIGESGPVKWALQGALVAPWGGHWIKGDVDSTDFGERSRKPFVQGRLRARWGEEEMRGEWYTGQMVQGLGDDIAEINFDQVPAPSRLPTSHTGGWVQMNLKPDASWTVGAGWGRSQANGQFVVIKGNDLFEFHTIWRPGGLPVISLELREIQTQYAAAGLSRTRQVNVGFGVEF